MSSGHMGGDRGGNAMAAGDMDVDLGRLFASFRRKWPRIALISLLVSAVAFLLAFMATPQYRAETRLLIETRESIYTRPEGLGQGNPSILDGESVASQVEVIASTDILMQVARDLNLAERPEFSGSQPSLMARFLVMAGLKDDLGNAPAEERILNAFREKLRVYRVENSRVIVIQFSAEDPELAATVANAVADAYVKVQTEAKQQSNTDATQWLEPEVADLRERVKDAEARVAEFRGKSDLLLGQNNTVLATQQLAELSSELSRVRASRSSAEARAASVRGALERGAAVEAQPDVLAAPLIQRLRERQIELQAQIADLSTTLLSNHPRIRALQSQLNDLDGQIRSEARKVLQGLEAEAVSARRQEEDLLGELNKLKVESARAEEEQVELRALEREAAAQRELLETYLTRFRQAAARRDSNYLPADVRVFSRALPPSEPYFPKIVPITLAAFAGSLLVMAILTLLQELFSGRAMRPAAGSAPLVPSVEMPEPTPISPMAAHRASAEHGLWNDAENAVTPDNGQINIEAAAERLISGGMTRALFVSPEGDDAAASAVLVAREVADAGLRVLLLDLTSSGAASLPMLESVAFSGITNLLASEAQFADVIHTDMFSDCHIVPVGTADPARAMRAADRLPIIMDSFAAAYDVVMVECGPADATAIKRLISADTEVLVSVIDPQDADSVTEAVEHLRAEGVSEPILVTPAGHVPPPAPPGRDAA